MRVLQLIDSLRPGGAEKMAVNIANALLPHIDGSYLCCTRQEGLLKEQLKPEVEYLFLNKKSSLDLSAFLRLRKFIFRNKITIVHAHSTSFFLASIIKKSGLKFNLIWHDHYGESEFLEKREYKLLKFFSGSFTGIISVNSDLKNWAQKNLNCKNVVEIRNFISEPTPSLDQKTLIKDPEKSFKIICVANLRPQKDHFNLLSAFEMLDPTMSVSLHLIGENPGTLYSVAFLEAISKSPVKQKIFYYGTQTEIIYLLKQADLGILASKSEGLPLALLEYGMAGLPVVCTRVGKCAELIGSAGKIVERENPSALYNGILFYLRNRDKMKLDAERFKFQTEKFSEKEVLKNLLQCYKLC
ncbi:glycosyltransferase [Antarcticibacterium sp. 1MA-6-2]|uniref:glycosyltransferase n=1 Tax=Antarcticibacterium sp. 1MA-6-2 TaxID=2908210 RepID=UPI001F1E3725|nr:glycosyltransferase [Antarcticibacterium sp. 1MA-6-2]UJH92492.1 glycosyltransferase [Antarcticibacterium sp. 1MA-6-2]